MNELFETRPRSAKLHCKVCGHAGYPWARYEALPPPSYWWAAACMRGHGPCPRCGKMLTLLPNGKARTHGRCPKERAA